MGLLGARFLDEQEQRRSPTTVARYRDVVELLRHDLDGYAYVSLEELDARRFEPLRNAARTAHGSSVRSSGPSTSCRTWPSSSAP